MSENLRVQRNAFDVALELTKLHIDKVALEPEEKIADIYAKYYSTASYLSRLSPETIRNLIPENILNNLKK